MDTALLNTVLNTVLVTIGLPLLAWLARVTRSLTVEVRDLKVIVLGAEGQGGLSRELGRFRDWKHDDFAPWANGVQERLAVIEHHLHLKGGA